MAALTSGSWTVGYPSGDRSQDVTITNRKKIIHLKLTMASGEWPSAGIALPGAGTLGFVRGAEYYMMSPRTATASGRTVFYALTTGHKVRAYQNALMSGTGRSFTTLATTITNASRIFFVSAIGW